MVVRKKAVQKMFKNRGNFMYEIPTLPLAPIILESSLEISLFSKSTRA